jgi:hypothetical protein
MPSALPSVAYTTAPPQLQFVTPGDSKLVIRSSTQFYITFMIPALPDKNQAIFSVGLKTPYKYIER